MGFDRFFGVELGIVVILVVMMVVVRVVLLYDMVLG